jgi:hypothetical protein
MNAVATPNGRSPELVRAARALLVLNPLIFAYVSWFLLPLDAQTPGLEHLRISAEFFVTLGVVSFTLGGWKALLLASRRARAGSRAGAWIWLALFGGYGALVALSLFRVGV